LNTSSKSGVNFFVSLRHISLFINLITTFFTRNKNITNVQSPWKCSKLVLLTIIKVKIVVTKIISSRLKSVNNPTYNWYARVVSFISIMEI
jgi:hypothetical protein